MAEFALVSPANSVVRFDANVDPSGAAVRPGWRWLPVARPSSPTFDQTTEVMVGPNVVLFADHVEVQFTKRNKTAAELDADKDTQVEGVQLAVFKLLFNINNRVRVLEGNAALSPAQFRALVKSLL